MALGVVDPLLFRRCYDCGLVKPIAEFAFANKAKGTRQSRCRPCHARYRRAHYLRNRATYIRQEVARIKRYREANRAQLRAFLRDHSCIDCGEKDILVLQFDHRDRSTKRGDIGLMLARKPWSRILDEIAKCDVRCANCHRLRTARQFRWHRLGVPADSNSVDVAAAGSLDGKRCSRCGVFRPLTRFAYRDRRRGRRRSWCRICLANYGAAYYARTRGRSHSRRSRALRAELRAQVFAYLRDHPCVDCGERDIVLLEFDHRDGVVKEETVGYLMARADAAEVWAEIAKCEVRCANCHHRRTAQQFGWSKLLA